MRGLRDRVSDVVGVVVVRGPEEGSRDKKRPVRGSRGLPLLGIDLYRRGDGNGAEYCVGWCKAFITSFRQ